LLIVDCYIAVIFYSATISNQQSAFTNHQIKNTMSYLHRIESKIFDPLSLTDAVHRWQVAGEKIVFTNGCFDLLHYGHVHYLCQARDLGDRLVIGLNSADSVRRLKGPTRPINDDRTRAYLLAALEFVDAVVVFGEDTPLDLIQRLHPDVLVKGGDWAVEQIVGFDLVMSRGGRVLSLPYITGYSTTSIEEKIRRNP
jgi:rfaE bifunctional protein nucleotidyltransferase chain/domain